MNHPFARVWFVLVLTGFIGFLGYIMLMDPELRTMLELAVGLTTFIVVTAWALANL